MTQQSEWIEMSMSKGGNTDANQFEADPGTYQFKLVEVVIDEGSNFEKTENFPVARFVWEDAEGDRFPDSFIKVPLGLKLNEKAAWTNRLSALAGRPLTEADRVQIRFSSPYVRTYDELAEAVKEVENGRKAFFKAEFLFEGQPLIGREALLTLGWNAKGTHLKCAAGGAAPVPNATGKKKRPAEQVAAPAAQQAPQAASKPPARPAPQQVQPGEVDLPF